MTPEGQVNPFVFVVVGRLFMMRGMEVSLLPYDHASIDRSLREVSVVLPASKIDRSGNTVERIWGCISPGGS